MDVRVGDHVWEEYLGATAYCGAVTRVFYLKNAVKSVETDHTVPVGRFQLKFVLAWTRAGWRNCTTQHRRAHARYTLVR